MQLTPCRVTLYGRCRSLHHTLDTQGRMQEQVSEAGGMGASPGRMHVCGPDAGGMGDVGAPVCPGGSRALSMLMHPQHPCCQTQVRSHTRGPAAARAGQGTHSTHAVSHWSAYMQAPDAPNAPQALRTPGPMRAGPLGCRRTACRGG